MASYQLKMVDPLVEVALNETGSPGQTVAGVAVATGTSKLGVTVTITGVLILLQPDAFSVSTKNVVVAFTI